MTHGSFTIDRQLANPPNKVFEAFANKAEKAKWFKGPAAADTRHEMDFKVGGHETNVGTFQGATHRFEATYYDIVPNEHLIYTYEMYLNDKRISVSLATIEFKPDGSGTSLVISEDGVFLAGGDNIELREQGTNQLLDSLTKSLDT